MNERPSHEVPFSSNPIKKAYDVLASLSRRKKEKKETEQQTPEEKARAVFYEATVKSLGLVTIREDFLSIF